MKIRLHQKRSKLKVEAKAVARVEATAVFTTKRVFRLSKYQVLDRMSHKKILNPL